MRKTQIAIIIGFDNHVSAICSADGRDMQTGEVSVPKEKCLAQMVGYDKPGQSLPNEIVTLFGVKHSDGNTYLVGLRPGADQNTNFESVISFAKGDKLQPFHWL